MTTIVTRAGKGSALSFTEMDANLTNLNTDKLEAATTATLTNKSISLATNTVSGTAAEFDAACSDANFVYESDIGVTVEAYDATILKDADIGVTVQAYDADIPTVSASQAEMEAGTEVALRSMSPLRVSQAIAALAPSTGYTGQFKNKIIGGDFTTNPWQRGTSFANPSSGTYTADRFKVVSSGAWTCTVSKDASTLSSTSLKINVDASKTPASGEGFTVAHIIEGLNSECLKFGTATAKTITISFKVRASKAGVYSVTLVNGASNRSYTGEYTINSANTEETKTITLTGDTSGTWAKDNTHGVGLYWCLSNGDGSGTTASVGSWQAANNYLGSQNNVNLFDTLNATWYVADIQLEAGQTATDFETRSEAQEDVECKRYYERIDMNSLGPINQYAPAAGTISTPMPFSVRKRIAPTTIQKGGTAFTHGGVATSSTVTSSTPDGWRLDVTTSGAGLYQCFGGSGSYVEAVSEL